MMLSAVVRTTSAHKESGIFYSNRRGLKESLCDSFGGHDIQYDIKKKRELYIFCGLVLFLIVLFVG